MRIGIRLTEHHLVGAAVLSAGMMRTALVRIGSAGMAAALTQLTADLSLGRPATIESVTVDISGALQPPQQPPMVLVRIAPRPPADAAHEARPPALPAAALVHCRGGHSCLGDELVAFDAAALGTAAAQLPPACRWVITGVGSLMNPQHERTAGRLLLARARPASIAYSHSFASHSFAVREHTAALNAALSPQAERIGMALIDALGAAIPRERLYAVTSDGGCVPVQTLVSAPVHALAATRAAALYGAAALSGVTSGSVAVLDGERTLLGNTSGGVLAVQPSLRTGPEAVVASAAAQHQVLPESQPLPPGCPQVTDRWLDRFSSAATAEAEGADITPRAGAVALLGIAIAPLSAGVYQTVVLRGRGCAEDALSDAEARVRARLVSYGAASADVSIVERRVTTGSYQHPRVVSVRVRGVAGRGLSDAWSSHAA